ncbi:sigma-70 family RNA polymerase sigma factor [Proteiniborus sp. MB09-C3]|uniref:RNA polymerase sigma factor n=1 Tax=Proteiniborus sp. MB09-C3 TaxID=3050072 RepID=UPI002554640A|nr:sigma-70 family RNA polymerase sigma factor [Proteiniborus sp. MB09-C3]WIV11823.1 sigma-70 family RNA polymerase sigma factor [Proteiniborus sp. MB09-C3]
MDQIYKAYALPVYKYLLTLVRDPGLAEELTAETFYRAMEKHKEFRGECKVLTWLCQIGKFVFYEEIRKNEKYSTILLEEKDLQNNSIFISPEKIFMDKEGQVEIYKSMRKLKGEIRELMYLRILGGLSFKEIGDIMGKNETWARVNFYRGKTKIQKELKENE